MSLHFLHLEKNWSERAATGKENKEAGAGIFQEGPSRANTPFR
jgi:hypothetical protein